MSHEAWLVLHVLGVVLLLGNILVTAVWKVLADRTKNPSVVAYAQRLVTVTDIAFTATGVILITVSGQVMADDVGGVFSGPAWLTIGWSLFIASGIIWVAGLIPSSSCRRGSRGDSVTRGRSQIVTGDSPLSGRSSAPLPPYSRSRTSTS
jgi:uncharacterized membrane protein